MLKFLISVLGWIPGVGEAIKIAYVSRRALEVVNGVKIDTNAAKLHGKELEDHISELTQQTYDEYLKPEVDKLGLPDFATNKVSEKSIGIISAKLKEKYMAKVSAV
jgi:hypothetical protein